MRLITLEEQHILLLQIANAFHKICIENEIPYYMLGGTQLGAVRHKGFIPWDDDMDFGVPREYFGKIVGILKKQLPANMHVLDIYNSNLYTDVLKIELLSTRIEEDGRVDRGINIDIFPLDYTNLKKNIISTNYLIYLTVKYNCFTYSPIICHGIVRSLLQYVMKRLHPIKKETFPGWIARVSIRNKNNFTAFANHFGFWNRKEIIDKDVFGSPVLYDFEGMKLYGVESFDKYLSSLYGNYMELPPKDKRHIHCSRAWIEE